jgi:hypothetical protein
MTGALIGAMYNYIRMKTVFKEMIRDPKANSKWFTYLLSGHDF